MEQDQLAFATEHEGHEEFHLSISQLQKLSKRDIDVLSQLSYIILYIYIDKLYDVLTIHVSLL